MVSNKIKNLKIDYKMLFHVAKFNIRLETRALTLETLIGLGLNERSYHSLR